MLVVDPKHFLGDIWLDMGIMTPNQFSTIQKCVDRFKVPSDIDRNLCKIASGFLSFTADQFKNWIVFYSFAAMTGILTDAHLQCWKHFVPACRILVEFEITHEDVLLADVLLLQICKRAERLYGKSMITPNMHLHCHPKECILDFGPIHSFWC